MWVKGKHKTQHLSGNARNSNPSVINGCVQKRSNEIAWCEGVKDHNYAMIGMNDPELIGKGSEISMVEDTEHASTKREVMGCPSMKANPLKSPRESRTRFSPGES